MRHTSRTYHTNTKLITLYSPSEPTQASNYWLWLAQDQNSFEKSHILQRFFLCAIEKGELCKLTFG